MQRPGVISWPLLVSNLAHLREYLLLYDELWVPGFNDSLPRSEDIERHDLDDGAVATVRELVTEGFIRAPRIDLKNRRSDPVVRALKQLAKESEAVFDKTFPTAKRAALEAGAATFNMDIALSRLITYLLWRDEQKPAYPVVFPFGLIKAVPAEINQVHGVLSIVLKRFPRPDASLPIRDLLAFKRDSDTRLKFERLWSWARKVAKDSANTLEVEEELDSLIREHSAHLEQLTKETRYESVEILLSTPANVIEDLVKLRFGNLIKHLLQFKRSKVNASGRELGLPGNDIAYITKATKLLSSERR
jgi:hypothetical protein